MEKQSASMSQSEVPTTRKLTYAPPQATFVPLKLEERLLACAKQLGSLPCANPFFSS
jgi:hypothetical protein